MLEYFELWRAAVVYFCNLHIISFAVRYRENSHGISKFKSFGTYSMTFNLDNRHFFLQTNHGNSDGIFKFKPFGTCSMTFWFHELITFSTVFLVERLDFEKPL